MTLSTSFKGTISVSLGQTSATPVPELLDAVARALEREGAAGVVTDEDGVSFTAGYAVRGSAHNVLFTIGSGHVAVVDRPEGRVLAYELRFAQFLIGSAVFSVLFGVFLLFYPTPESGLRAVLESAAFAAIFFIGVIGINVPLALVRFPRFLGRALSKLAA